MLCTGTPPAPSTAARYFGRWDDLRKSTADKDQGFTLIELVVVIIGIAIPVFLNQRKKGVDASMKADLKNTATLAETIATANPTLAPYGADAAH